MTEKFKSTDYVKIVKDIIPHLDNAENPLNLGNVPDYPDLKNVIMIGDKPIQGMINFNDLEGLWDSRDDLELIKREKEIDFESPTNI